jgi:hypothetical protein
MPELRSHAIEPARAAWHGWLSTAQRLRQLTQDRASPCEHLIASLQRWPSFAAADPWAINAQMPAGPEPAEGQSPTKRPRQSHGVLPPAATARAAPRLSTHAVVAPRQLPGVSPRQPATMRTGSAPTTVPTALRAEADALSTGASDARASRAAVDSIASAGSAIAALVAGTIGRHVAGAALAGSAASSSPWSAWLPDGTEPAPATQPTATSPPATPGDSRPALQAVDLPMRAALERIAQAEASTPATAPLAPAAELLQRLLPHDVSVPSATHASEATAAQRPTAPRAPSRLLAEPGRSVSAPVSTPRSAAPEDTLTDRVDASGDDGSDNSADAISRLLADQAWLRGVDFT